MPSADISEHASQDLLDPSPIAYVKIHYIDGVRTCVLFDDIGDPVMLSEHGMVPLFSWAADRGIAVLSVH